MSPDDQNASCSCCGQSFRCEIAAGKSRCWCFEVPARLPVEGASCLCAACLAAAIAIRCESPTCNAFGQPVGQTLVGWNSPPIPARKSLVGRFCRLEPLDAVHHTRDLFEAFGADRDGPSWTYLPYGPFADISEFETWVKMSAEGSDPLFFAIVDQVSNRAAGVASYLRISPNVGTIEIGHLNFSAKLQRTTAATEGVFLLIRNAFDLGYRRCEWKCDSLNGPSRSAALRLGFTFEGVFRQAVVMKNRNRDTAWYSIVDSEWPALLESFQNWLDPLNFDSAGRQKVSLRSMVATRPV